MFIYNEWRNLQKHATRKNEIQKKNEEKFKEKLKDLFDIAHANALQMINLEKDRQFLILQRKKGRPVYFSRLIMHWLEKIRK